MPRHENDFYETPRELTDLALMLLPDIKPWAIVDPGAGTGVWGAAVRRRWHDSFILGVDPHFKKIAPGYDAWSTESYLCLEGLSEIDLIVGNPPYSFAEEFIRHGLTQLREGGTMMFLLRLGFLESQTRNDLWMNHPPISVTVLQQRPSFTGDGGTDAQAYGLFTWVKGEHRIPSLFWLSWR